MCLGGDIRSERTTPGGFVEISFFHKSINSDPNSCPYPSKQPSKAWYRVRSFGLCVGLSMIEILSVNMRNLIYLLSFKDSFRNSAYIFLLKMRVFVVWSCTVISPFQ